MDNRSVEQCVMVVDDEQDIRDASERILSRMGFKVLKASRGDQALKRLETEAVSIVLLDLKMPGMDGIEVLGHIQRMQTDIVVIVITGFATVETAIEAMKKGAYDFIPKPFEPDQLRIIVRRASEKIALKKEKEALAREKERTLLDLGTEKSRIRTIVESLPNGLLVTNSESRVVLMNPAFMQFVDLDRDLELGKTVEQYVEDPSLCELIRDISTGRHVDFEDIPAYEFTAAGDRYLMARGKPVIGARGECLGAVVNVVDITTLKVLDRMKSEFVAKVSHELRSPLSTIHEQLAVVLNDLMEVAPPDDHKILSRAKEKTHGLISLIGDLLDLSRIEEGVICKENKPIEPKDLLLGIVAFMQTRADAKQQTLKLECPEAPLPNIVGDPLALESIFGNLIANAVNYTQEGGRIVIRVDVTDTHLRVKVQDNGFGIEARHLEKIFDRFYRVKTDQTRYITGTGLGLPIVKELVSSMNGYIDVDSTPNKGSTFTVLLPAKTTKT